MLGAVMGRIDPKGAGRTGRVPRVRSAALGALMLVAACGDDRGQPFIMPPGGEFDVSAADRVLVVVESQNECASLGSCTPNPASPCDVGEGNARGLAVYRLGTTGRLLSATGDRAGALPEEIIATADNPRRILAHPNDPTLLYVATLTRVQVFRLAPGGGSTCIDQTIADKDIVPDLDEDLEPVDLLIDPAFGANGVLYIAGERGNRVDAYEIALDGTLPDLPTSCIVGSSAAEFSSLAVVNSALFATAGRDRIEVYSRVNGHFPDVQAPTPTPNPTATPEPGEDAPSASSTATSNADEPTPVGTPSPAPTCIEALRITVPISSLGAGFVTDIEFLPALTSDKETLGDLVVAEEFTQRLTSFPIDPNGDFDGRDNGSTTRGGFYQRILRVVRAGTTLLYTTAFQDGQIDVYALRDPSDDEERLSGKPLSKTRSDPFSLPVGLTIDGDSGPILYVAQEGLGRVDGFRIRPDGGTDEVPVTSTPLVQDVDDQTLDLFPNDVLIVPLAVTP